MIFNAQDATYECFENFFNFSAFWAFGGNLLEEYRKHFSDWWREKWQRNVEYPDDSSVSYNTILMVVIIILLLLLLLFLIIYTG